MNNNEGFTLVEVLVAVAILGIALLAVVRSSSQITGNTSYIREKTIAFLVARDVVARTKAGVQNLPTLGSSTSGTMNMMNNQWRWQMTVDKTRNQNIEAIKVTVKNNTQQRILANLTGFILIDDRGEAVL